MEYTADTGHFHLHVADWEGIPMYTITNKNTDVVEWRGISNVEALDVLDAKEAQLTKALDMREKRASKIKLVK